MVNFDDDIEQSLLALRSGGTIIYPTDTVWGIGADATNPGAVDKIFQLKHRPDHKSMIVLVADERDILQYVAAPDLAIFDYLQTVTKPTTVIYDGAIGLADNLLAADGSIGIRICQEPFCRHLIKRFRKPIVSTSANISGEPTPAVFAQINPTLLNQVDHVVNYRRDDITYAPPSSVIRWANGNVEVIRP